MTGLDHCASASKALACVNMAGPIETRFLGGYIDFPLLVESASCAENMDEMWPQRGVFLWG